MGTGIVAQSVGAHGKHDSQVTPPVSEEEDEHCCSSAEWETIPY
jgi:hypothetical protein